jgi:hypothetical protein
VALRYFAEVEAIELIRDKIGQDRLVILAGTRGLVCDNGLTVGDLMDRITVQWDAVFIVGESISPTRNLPVECPVSGVRLVRLVAEDELPPVEDWIAW